MIQGAISPEKESLPLKIGESGSCNLDAACNPAIDIESKSVARMQFVEGGNSYLCTGTLMNNRAQDETPYFLSANHCISTQTVASTLTTDWFYRSSACNSVSVSPATRTLTGGATLLYAASRTDTSLMRLNNTPPAGVVFAGWEADVQSLGVSLLGLHNPSGDVQKYSNGSVTGYASCTSSTSGSFSCSQSTVDSSSHLTVQWNSGTTETGSSGSGIFVTRNGERYLVGQLHGGSASCFNPSGTDIYGRFDLAYSAALSQWLSPPPSSISRAPVYRFFNTITGAHFFTSSAAERDNVLATLPNLAYEGIAFYTYSSSGNGTSPVFRFLNNQSAAHFYTISFGERDSILANLPWFASEGIGWYASTSPASQTIPLYRFYKHQIGTHFYTTNSSERDYIIANLPQYNYEGVGYHVWSTR